MRLTKFGKVNRTLRILRDMKLRTMADALGVSSSFLSSVEAGRRPVPETWFDEICDLLELSMDDAAKLRAAIDSQTGVRKIEAKRPEEARFLAAYKRNAEKLDTQQLELMLEMVEQKEAG